MFKDLEIIDGSLYKNIYACGDIHGCFSLLDNKLKLVNFNTKTDLLITCGDLIDRGPESHLALEYLQQSWFKSTLGNHEMLRIENPNHSHYGYWFTDTVKEKQKFIETLTKLPLSIQLDLEDKSVGFAHAALPCDMWPLGNGYTHISDIFDIVWDRSLFKKSQREEIYIKNIDHLYLGHNISPKVFTSGNITFLDTGAWIQFVYPKEAAEFGYDLTLEKIK